MECRVKDNRLKKKKEKKLISFTTVDTDNTLSYELSVYLHFYHINALIANVNIFSHSLNMLFLRI